MKLRICLYTSFTCFLIAGYARGQSLPGSGTDVAIGYQGLPAKSMGQTKGGIQLSDSALVHVGVGAEAGYDTNVFYSASNAQGSPILRVVPFFELTNASRGGNVTNADVYFDLGASLTYREYLSNDPLIRDQRAFMPAFFGNLELGRVQNLSFSINEGFTRSEDPPYVNQGQSTQPIIRDINMASAAARWAPGGGRLAAMLQYTNTLDAFETNNLRVANSMGHLLTADLSWKWLPKTAVVLQISQGYITYFNTNEAGKSKPTSYPLHALGGLRGLITAKLAVNLLAGYSNGFYSNVPGPSGFRGNFSLIAEGNYHPTLLSTIVVGYRHDFQNAVLGNFYYLDAAYLNVGQAIAGRFGLGFTARYESRSFQGVPLADGITFISRHDNFWQVGLNLDYHIRDWSYFGLAYILMSNGSDYEPMAANDPGRVNYLKQLVFARVGVTY